MPTDQARLNRLHRLERVRAIAKQALVAEVAEAEGTLAQLQALAARTEQLAQDYGAGTAFHDGHELIQRNRFVAGLHGITTATRSDAATARELANRKQQELATAERRRAAVETRADAQARQISQRDLPIALGTRRGFGTGLE